MTMQEIIAATKELDRQHDALVAEMEEGKKNPNPVQFFSFMERGELMMAKREELKPIFDAAVETVNMDDPEQKEMMLDFARYMLMRIKKTQLGMLD